jgi:hypothetical protein
MSRGERRGFRVLGLVAVSGTVLVGALAVRAMGADHPTAGPRQRGDAAPPVVLPLAVAGYDLANAPSPPTVAPTPVPTETATPSPTPTATPFVCGPLPERVRVRAIDVSPLEVRVSSGRGRTTWPIYLAPLADGGAKVAWADSAGSVHVTTLDAQDQRVGPDATLTGDEVRGLVAHDDGGTALLVVKGVVLSLVRLDATGVQTFRKDLIGLLPQTTVGSKWVDDWGHEARLDWVGRQYVVYSGHTQFFGSNGKHQGDLLWLFDGDGNRVEVRGTGWDWGCSHSLDLRLAHNTTRIGPVCLSDAYPKPGFHFNHSEAMIRAEPSGNGQGGSDARLGGWVALRDGFLMSFASPEGRASTDVGLIKVGNDAKIGPPHWLTDTAAVTEDGPHLARIGRDEYLASWTADARHLLAVVDEAGTLLDGPAETTARVAPRDDFQTLPDGDVAWAAAWDNLSQLKVVRVDACGSPPVFTPVPPTATATPVRPTEVPTAGPSPTATAVPTGGPRQCANVLANGGFEDGLNGWTYAGEASLGFSDRSGGKYGVELLGRNDVTAGLRQRVTLPVDAVSAHLVFWWKMTSAEAESSTKPYDLVNVSASGATDPPGVIEVLSNLAGRTGWLPSAYEVPVTEASEVVFQAQSNRRDVTTFLIDDVQLVACTGARADFPSLGVVPASGTAGMDFAGKGVGFQPGEAVSHWVIEPDSALRFDLGTATAGQAGGFQAIVRTRATTGLWHWNAVGAASQLPGTTTFMVTSARQAPPGGDPR